jgi:hypothetical protein
VAAGGDAVAEAASEAAGASKEAEAAAEAAAEAEEEADVEEEDDDDEEEGEGEGEEDEVDGTDDGSVVLLLQVRGLLLRLACEGVAWVDPRLGTAVGEHVTAEAIALLQVSTYNKEPRTPLHIGRNVQLGMEVFYLLWLCLYLLRRWAWRSSTRAT